MTYLGRMRERMKKTVILMTLLVFSTCLLNYGCAKKEEPPAVGEKAVGSGNKPIASLEIVEVAPDTPLYYIPVAAAEASSFDTTPDWAPAPNPMGAADEDTLTRWSSDYEEASQWIYFDLGGESVVNNVIIRWERAYASKYRILVSKNAKKWQEVYREENCKGGAMEAEFPPVKCRYIKILGTEKVEENWGISIWEVEIFGPKSHNPSATVPKEEYLARGEDESKRKEADKLMEELSAPVVPLNERSFQQGAVYTSWMADELSTPASDFTLIRLREMGFDTISIMIPAYQDDLDSKVVFTNDKPDGDTPTDESLKHAVETCHKLGLRVMMKPHVDPRTDEARINIIPSEEWFDSYKEFILRYAVFSQENNVEILSVGTELEGTTFDVWNPRWKDIIAKVREIFKGQLTYSANWTEYKEVPFWNELDYIGIDAYFPLTTKNDPTLEELVAAWDKKADEMQEWLKGKGLIDKGIILTEIGYTSTDGTNRQPWVAISNREDQREQADCLQAMFESFSNRPWFKGYYLWQYMPQERWSPLGFTINDKKAEEVVTKWLKKFEKKEEEMQKGGFK